MDTLLRVTPNFWKWHIFFKITCVKIVSKLCQNFANILDCYKLVSKLCQDCVCVTGPLNWYYEGKGYAYTGHLCTIVLLHCVKAHVLFPFVLHVWPDKHNRDPRVPTSAPHTSRCMLPTVYVCLKNAISETLDKIPQLQGIGKRAKGTDTIFFIKKEVIPSEK